MWYVWTWITSVCAWMDVRDFEDMVVCTSGKQCCVLQVGWGQAQQYSICRVVCVCVIRS